MVKVRLETGREHVAELARLRDPIGAVEELIWNSVDADAGRVVVTLERNDLGGVDRVSVQMTDTLRELSHQPHNPPGCALDQPTYRIWVRTWGELVQDCEARLRFYGQQLEYQSSTEHAMDYLVRNHGDAVAELVAAGTVPPPRRDGQPPAAYDTKSAQADDVSAS